MKILNHSKYIFYFLILLIFNTKPVFAEEYNILFKDDIEKEKINSTLNKVEVVDSIDDIGYFIVDTDNIETIENGNNIEHIECQKAHDVIYPPSKESYASKVSNNNLWPQQWDIKK